jgi:NAD(P)-dependent dehydrogenase (short-subunit alcohol dehydrogenase family)
MGDVVVVGGTQGLGLALAIHYAEQGRSVVLTGRDKDRTAKVADEIANSANVTRAGGTVRGFALDLNRPEDVNESLSSVENVDRLALVAIERDQNSIKEYDIGRAVHLTTLKLVGYSAVVHALVPALSEQASILMFGGVAKDRSYPGSTTVSTVNGGIAALMGSLTIELAPVRVNVLHPGIVPDTPYWQDKKAMTDGQLGKILTGRHATTADMTNASAFLLENPSANGINLNLDGGFRHT